MNTSAILPAVPVTPLRSVNKITHTARNKAKRSECNHYNITSQAEQQEEEVEEEEVVIRSTRTRPKKGTPEGFVRNGVKLPDYPTAPKKLPTIQDSRMLHNAFSPANTALQQRDPLTPRSHDAARGCTREDYRSRPARATPSNPWLSEVLREHRTELRAAERKWHKSKDASDLSMYQSLLSSFSVDVHAAKSSYFHNKINSSSNTRLLFKTFNSLLCPPPPPPASSLTADDFATFFTNKTTAISSQFSAPHTQEPRPTPSTANTPLSSFSSLTEEEVSTLLLSSHPTTCPLDPIPSHLLQAISPTLLPSLTHIINSSLHTGTFPTAFKQARVTPLLKKPTLNTSFVDNYRPISLLPFIAKTLERAVFNQLTSFLSLNNQLDVNQSGFKKGHSTETALLSVTEATEDPSVHPISQGSVLGPLLFSIYTTSLGHIIQAHGFCYHCYADDTQLFLSFQPDDPTVAARVSSCLADISTWMKEHHLQLNLAKTELLVLPANPSLQHDFTIQLESSLITPSRSALVISRLDYCNALLAGLPACATKPLQMIQNAAARLVFNEPKRAHVTPLFISLHWLPLAARIKFKALTLAYRTITGSAPSYFHSLLRVYIPTRHLRSVNERRLVVPSQKATKSLSRTFSFTVPCWWNALPTLIRNAESLTTFKKQLKTNLFREHLTL
ncbi:hypothetical protein PO909_033794 [Leuciscus waleckii]